MGVASAISIEDYLRRTEKPNCEYEAGVLHPKALPTTLHAWIQSILILLLNKQGCIALSELTVRVTPTTFLVPDVAVVRALEFPYPQQPALLCVEILSPEDRIGAMLAKCEKYHAWGVPTCWVIDPEKRTAWEYHAGQNPIPMSANENLRAGEIVISLTEIFAAVPPQAQS